MTSSVLLPHNFWLNQKCFIVQQMVKSFTINLKRNSLRALPIRDKKIFQTMMRFDVSWRHWWKMDWICEAMYYHSTEISEKILFLSCRMRDADIQVTTNGSNSRWKMFTRLWQRSRFIQRNTREILHTTDSQLWSSCGTKNGTISIE